MEAPPVNYYLEVFSSLAEALFLNFPKKTVFNKRQMTDTTERRVCVMTMYKGHVARTCVLV
jgi:hypothetical protein